MFLHNLVCQNVTKIFKRKGVKALCFLVRTKIFLTQTLYKVEKLCYLVHTFFYSDNLVILTYFIYILLLLLILLFVFVFNVILCMPCANLCVK